LSERDVFINCPFSSDYDEHFQAITFTVQRSGFKPRCARESDDGGEVRIDKILRIIRESPYGIHDISKTEPDPVSGLPRFNMPFELGLYLGARTFGGPAQNARNCSFSIVTLTVINGSSPTSADRTSTPTTATSPGPYWRSPGGSGTRRRTQPYPVGAPLSASSPVFALT
jgi:hypothetical protein